MAKTTTWRRRQNTSDKSRDYGKKGPHHIDVLSGRIWKCTDPDCIEKGPYTLQGIKVHNFRMHGSEWSQTVRNDGHPLPATIMCHGQDLLNPSATPASAEPKARKFRQSAGRVAPAATINYCPCCGTCLQAFHAAADIAAGS
jgi:hypothetical protein